jgi:aryl carrier-like protein
MESPVYASMPRDHAAWIKELLNRMRTSTCSERALLIEAYLRETAAQVLCVSVQEIEANDHLLEHGLDSLLAMDLLGRCEADLCLSIQPREVFERPRISLLAHWLAEQCAGTPDIGHAEPFEEGRL